MRVHESFLWMQTKYLYQSIITLGRYPWKQYHLKSIVTTPSYWWKSTYWSRENLSVTIHTQIYKSSIKKHPAHEHLLQVNRASILHSTMRFAIRQPRWSRNGNAPRDCLSFRMVPDRSRFRCNCIAYPSWCAMLKLSKTHSIDPKRRHSRFAAVWKGIDRVR